MENKVYDVCIIGAGPAGMTAAIYAARAGKTVCLIDKEGFGGQIAKSPRVENIPGFKSISGAEFTMNMFAQATAYENVDSYIEEVSLIKYFHGLYKVYFSTNDFVCSLSLIIATGAKPRTLDLDTKNIYYCATCDGPFFKNKDVLVVGSGNTGLAYALELANYCKNVHICDVTTEMCGENVSIDRVKNTKNIIWHPNCTITTVNNSKGAEAHLTSVVLSNGETVKCNAIFSAIGTVPQTDIISEFAHINEYGFIETVDDIMVTDTGLFAAGDCRNGKIKQVTTACADGTKAAIAACKFVDSIKQ